MNPCSSAWPVKAFGSGAGAGAGAASSRERRRASARSRASCAADEGAAGASSPRDEDAGVRRRYPGSNSLLCLSFWGSAAGEIVATCLQVKTSGVLASTLDQCNTARLESKGLNSVG